MNKKQWHESLLEDYGQKYINMKRIFKVINYLLPVVPFIQAQPAANASRPNVVFILADDLGYEALGVNGSADYNTPNLDRMAEEGMRFENCFSQPLSSPTRVQLLTGMYNNRNYTKWAVMSEKDKTIGHMVKEVGYATALAGKWQLSNDGLFPGDAGFDANSFWAYGFDLEKIGFKLKYPKKTPDNYYYNEKQPEERYMVVNNNTPSTTSRYFYPCLIQNDTDFVVTTEQDYGPEINAQFALNFIGKNKNQPFLLYMPLILTHDPFEPTPATPGIASMTLKEKFNEQTGNFKYMVEWMDLQVGLVLDKLKELGLEENTLIIFTGDNGTARQITTKMKDGSLVAGGKGLSTDAGIHVPLIVKWKGKIKGKSVCSDLIDFTDFMPTIADVTGASLPKGPGFFADGRSFLPQLLGKKGKPRDWVFFHYDRNPEVAAVNPDYRRARFVRNKAYKLYDTGELYNVKLDKDEKHAISETKQSKAEKSARKKLQKVLDTMPVPPGYQTPEKINVK